MEEPSAHSQQPGGEISPPAGDSPTVAPQALPAPARLSPARRQAAVAALQRFADKLGGRDAELRGGHRAAGVSGPATAQSVPDQVSALLRAAMSIDNLSRMYEGWTPWL